MKFCTDIHCSQRVYPSDFSGALIFPLITPAGLAFSEKSNLARAASGVATGMAISIWVNWSGLKYLIDWRDCCEICYRYPWCPEDDALTFPLVPPASQIFHVSCEISQHLLGQLVENTVQTFMVPS